MKQFSCVLGILLAAGSSMVSANDGYAYQCTFGERVRTIEVVYLQRESSLPCEVNYIKEGQQENLWNSRYTKGYCEAKAEEFIERQEEWGWSCTRSDEAKTDVEPKAEPARVDQPAL